MPDERPEKSDEAKAWEEIVAAYDEPAYEADASGASGVSGASGAEPVPRWPVTEDLPDESGTEPETGSTSSKDSSDDSEASDEDLEPTEEELAVARRAEEREAEIERREREAQGTFVPPAPAPLPKLDTAGRVMVAGLVGGPLVFLLAVIFDVSLPSWLVTLGVVGIIGGFLMLVLRLKGGPPDDEDGAIV